ncbi:hypothetical protein [Arthrobacter sp. StoSoilB13]|uniref:hypothetical protein n=1 Tax=Arthrobacter sp. StoSoilB13 TaxID=2830993 RepID=UPI001CC4DBDB|nr:hypothetical protein [Arthrobacter sp. StoSoilB13]BCW47920.1 hypothetical protein StoSoilB13_02620 [Arthrobacter sp. StoSoilB13]
MATQVEIVNPKLDGTEAATRIIGSLFGLAYRVLFIWWAVAVWFPELGLTYWQLVLPVYAVRMLIGKASIKRTAKR